MYQFISYIFQLIIQIVQLIITKTQIKNNKKTKYYITFTNFYSILR